MKPHLIFVDDEPNILHGLRRSLRTRRSEWEISFAEGGEEALELCRKHPADAVISDMRMPRMDGAELLTRIGDACPTAIRFVLSGEADLEAIYRAVGSSHQYLLKPCESEALVERLDRVLAARPAQAPADGLACITRTPCLPTPAATYDALLEEVRSADPSMERVASLMGGDVALSFKALQLINSGFFGSGMPTLSPVRAIERLGIETITQLAGLEGFAQRLATDTHAEIYQVICTRSRDCAAAAREESTRNGLTEAETDAAVTAHLLGAVADLALLAAGIGPARFRRQDAALTGYMLALWGLPDAILTALEETRPWAICGDVS